MTLLTHKMFSSSWQRICLPWRHQDVVSAVLVHFEEETGSCSLTWSLLLIHVSWSVDSASDVWGRNRFRVQYMCTVSSHLSVPGSPMTMVLIFRAKLAKLESFLPCSALLSSWLRNRRTSSEASIPRTISFGGVCCNIDDYWNEDKPVSMFPRTKIVLFLVKVYHFTDKVQTRISLLEF